MYGRTNELLPRSLGHPTFPNATKEWVDEGDDESDWANYYVNMYIFVSSHLYYIKTVYRFADRDMFMRFVGGGIGHKSLHKWCSRLARNIEQMVDDIDDADVQNNSGTDEEGEEARDKEVEINEDGDEEIDAGKEENLDVDDEGDGEDGNAEKEWEDSEDGEDDQEIFDDFNYSSL
jgi:hypothetical protein